MTKIVASEAPPVARFTIEREPTRGYQITRAEGTQAEQWRTHALDLLEKLEQPSPTGAVESYQWLEITAPARLAVGVTVKREASGEVCIYQTWFVVPRRTLASQKDWLTLLGLLSLVFILGLFSGRRNAPKSSADVGPNAPREPVPATSSSESPANNQKTITDDSLRDLFFYKLRGDLTASAQVREKLHRFLSQAGFAADFANAVVHEQRSIKLISDLDIAPPPQETMRLSNLEVAKLLKLLETCDKWPEAIKTRSGK